jgi:dTDP-4-dehydrorhamnose 3,5-epimerase
VEVLQTSIPDLLILEPRVFVDERGFFLESWNARRFAELVGCETHFVQDNHSRSRRGVLRGLHYQLPKPQSKLVYVAVGRIFDVAVDLRRSSSTFGHWVGAELSEHNHHQMWIPAGFAHGFVVLSDSADLFYKSTEYYAPEHERCVLWNDPAIGVEWPIDGEPILSEKDRVGRFLRDAEVFQ